MSQGKNNLGDIDGLQSFTSDYNRMPAGVGSAPSATTDSGGCYKRIIASRRQRREALTSVSLPLELSMPLTACNVPLCLSPCEGR